MLLQRLRVGGYKERAETNLNRHRKEMRRRRRKRKVGAACHEKKMPSHLPV
jgi:hypothetical protein